MATCSYINISRVIVKYRLHVRKQTCGAFEFVISNIHLQLSGISMGSICSLPGASN